MRSISRIMLAASAVLACFAAQPLRASAQTTADNAEVCYNEDDGYEFEEAVTACTALIQSGTETPEQLAWDLHNRALAYTRLSDHARAAADFDQVLLFNPQDAGALYWRGRARLALGNEAGGVADIREAVRLNPQLPGAAALLTRLAAASAPIVTFRDCAECPEMVTIPAGSFTMGSPDSEAGRDSDEGPQHVVSIRAFAVSKYEITFAQWDACVASGGCGAYVPADEGWGRGDRPVMYISRDDAHSYLTWLNRRVGGERYRMLNEAEWEYAARAGTTSMFWWGASVGHQYANYDADESGADDWTHTAPVGSFPANAFGLHDMFGNVAELLGECWTEYDTVDVDGPINTMDCRIQVVRGGSWGDDAPMLRSANREWIVPGNRYINYGLRVARMAD